MEIYTTSQARENLFKLVDQTSTEHEPIYIVGKRHKAVLISEEDYSSMIETLYLTSIPGMKESLINARKTPLDQYSDHLDWDAE